MPIEERPILVGPKHLVGRYTENIKERSHYQDRIDLKKQVEDWRLAVDAGDSEAGGGISAALPVQPKTALHVPLYQGVLACRLRNRGEYQTTRI